MHHATRLACLFFIVAAIGCVDSSEYFHEARALLPAPVALDQKLVFVDAGGHRAYLLDASSKALSARATEVGLPYAPRLAQRRNGDHDEALVLCDGRRGSATASAAPAALSAIDARGRARHYELGKTPFARLAQSDDGRYAIVFRAPQTEPGQSGRLLETANEIAIIDLDETPGNASAVRHVTPSSLDNAPRHAVVSPSMRVAMQDRRLLVLLSASEVTFIDLDNPDRRATVAHLGDDTRVIAPEQVLFGEDATVYVRGAGSDDIFMFRLEPQDNGPGRNDFRPSINQLAGGHGPRDMALFGPPAEARLLVVSASGEALVVDPGSSKSTTVALPYAASRILLFEGRSLADSQVRTRALLYHPGSAGLAFLDLHDLEARRARNVEAISISSTLETVIPITDEQSVVLIHEDRGASLLHLEQRAITPVSSSTPLSSAAFDESLGRLWVGPSGQPWIGLLDLDTGTTDEVLLDEDIRVLVPMFSAGRLAIVHESALGHVTFLDTTNPSREAASAVRGFLVAGVLDRGEP